MTDHSNSLEGRKIILGITGSIAAYKSAVLLRLLIKAGADVQVIMTNSSKDFVGSLTFSTLSNKKVLSELNSESLWSNHVELGLWADLMIIAPCSANTLAKLSTGLVDNLLTAVYLSAKCPVMIAAAMDLDMWKHPSTQNNIQKLKEYGNQIIPVGDGPLASGLSGPGRLSEPEDIFQCITDFFLNKKRLQNKRILITAGPTHEPIDPVRYIGNHSSGKMGIRIAEEAIKMGAQVELILGPVKEFIIEQTHLHITRIKTAADMMHAVQSKFKDTDIFILAAAVADFKPKEAASDKIKKKNQEAIALSLIPTDDIAAYLGNLKRKDQFLCGFALETTDIEKHAREKLVNKKMDMIVINSTKDQGAAFDYDTNKIMILDNSGKLISFELKSKKEVAVDILNEIIERQMT